MRPITKNIIVVDESGKEYTSTYAKRAKGLVKGGRARWLDGNTICLVCPPDTLNLEDHEMENRADNMEIINVVSENEDAKKAQAGAVMETEKLQPAVTAADILSRIDRIIAQGADLQNAVAQIHSLPVNESPEGGQDGAARAQAIGSLYQVREITNQKMIDLLQQMYNDIVPKKADVSPAKVKMAETILQQGFMGVGPETAEAIFKFINSTLM